MAPIHPQVARSPPTTDILKFDTISSSAGIDFSDGDRVAMVTAQERFIRGEGGYSSGVHSWEMLLLDDERGNEMVSFGICRERVADEDFRTSEDMWTIQASTGNCWAKGVKLPQRLPKIHPGDTLRCELDCNKSTLRCFVNGGDEWITGCVVKVSDGGQEFKVLTDDGILREGLARLRVRRRVRAPLL